MNLLNLIGRTEPLFEPDIAAWDTALSEAVSASRFMPAFSTRTAT